jgi:hypothetical protein
MGIESDEVSRRGVGDHGGTLDPPAGSLVGEALDYAVDEAADLTEEVAVVEEEDSQHLWECEDHLPMGEAKQEPLVHILAEEQRAFLGTERTQSVQQPDQGMEDRAAEWSEVVRSDCPAHDLAAPHIDHQVQVVEHSPYGASRGGPEACSGKEPRGWCKAAATHPPLSLCMAPVAAVATPPDLQPMYRPRGPDPLRTLFRRRFPDFQAANEQRYASKYGRFRLPLITRAASSFQVYGDCSQGIARIRCPSCGFDRFRPFS